MEQKPFPELPLKDSEIRYRRLFETAQDGILILDARTGMIEDVNPYLINMLGYSREEFMKKKLWEVGAFKDIKASKEAFEELQDREYIRYEDLPLKAKDGRLVQVEFISNVYWAGSEKVIQCNIRDNMEHKLLIAALQENEKIYRDLINQSPDGYFIIELSGNILSVNKAMCKELKFSEEEFLSMNIWDIIPEELLGQYRERLTKILEGKSLKEAAEEYEVREKNGEIHYVEVLSAPRYIGRDIIGFQGIARDITARKRTEAALRASEHRFKMASWATKDIIWERNFPANTISWNDSMQKLFHYKAEEIEPTVDWWQDHIHPAERANVMASIQAAIVEGENFWSKEYRFRLTDGSYADVFDRGYILYDEQGQPLQFIGAMVDVTEQKRAERSLRSSEEKYRTLVMHLPTVVYTNPLEDASSTLYISPQIERLLGYTPQEWLADPKLWSKAIHPEDRQRVLEQTAGTNQSKEPFEMDYRMTARDGRLVWVHDQLTLVNDLEGKPQYWQGIMLDITESKRAQDRIQRQLEHLTATSAIDRVIADNFDLKLSLSEILRHVTKELGVDAADILILETNSQMLEYGAERGFHTKAARRAPLYWGEGYAGRVALERQLVQVPDPGDVLDNLLLKAMFKEDGFVCYFGVPLIIKGQVKGVLEIFHRTSLEPNTEWFDFLYTLAGQAAIAIENFMLFDGLQRSNSELMLAYETTLEGWSRALDLRDKETEGHTQRVTEMTVKLARAYGLSAAELLNVRRGGLLHDIGKMGVPDHILLKPGELTKEEWRLMRMHPVYAYDLLSHIAYLREALDIPYCHHEKWDGTGYPRGLKGNQIPLTARIFAVADVWDALTSDRPYRPAWTEEKALEYIRTSGGTHFDPQVVEAFMQVNGRIPVTP